MKEAKSDYVYHQIRNRIDSNKYPPNKQLTEVALCKQFGVSRTPVREAIQRLVSEEYLVYTPGIGLTVANINLMELVDVYDIREVLECLAIRLFFNKYTIVTVKRLEQILLKQQQAFLKKDNAAFMQYDMEFHRTIFDECGNKRLRASLENIYNLINRIAILNKDDAALDELALKHHKVLYDCIVNDKPERAAELVRDHIQLLKAYYLKRYL